MPRDAAYFRRHRQQMLLAQELRCTPKEAEEEMRRRELRERARASADRLHARMHAPLVPAINLSGSEDAARDPKPWLMRDLDR